jgi:3-hydroxy-9,10-secoandrosta-1,3,5(10)-triene-9,17-dione monooxygenase reductase component
MTCIGLKSSDMTGAGEQAEAPLQASFTPREFRDALGLYPTGVAIVTTGAGESRRGMTVNSFTSVSLDPPLVSFNLAKSLRSIDTWLNAQTFAINLLHESQNDISSGFARALADKWSCADCVEGVTQNPVLASHLAVFECERYACYEAGDHVIMLGRVVHFTVGQEAPPLVFYRGKYRKIGDPLSAC